MPSSAIHSTWRKILDEHFSQLTGQLENQIDHEVETRVEARIGAQVDHAVAHAVAETKDSARLRLAEELNQAVRRMRQCDNPAEIAPLLADIAAPYCDRAFVFFFRDGMVRSEVAGNAEPGARIIEFPVSHGAAFLSARETRDPVVAMSTPAEVSAEVVEALTHVNDQRVHLFPLVVHGEVTSVLYATGEAQAPALELIAGVAALQFEAKAAKPAQPRDAGAELVSIGAAPTASSSASPDQPSQSTTRLAGWWDLSREEQQVHLAAQRFARVKVAEMRLYRADAVSSGRVTRDLYGALREPIDTARDEFRNRFMAACPSMVDYLHLELIRSLAHEDVELLGPEYPGPII